ncbi:MAG: SIMPL domain-containing protein [Desulfobaccales bacterium]|nr:SIMPL domain-containing protein [Desulfobaccales bacterium]
MTWGSDGLLETHKKILGPEEKVQSLSYRLTPIRSYKDKSQPGKITGYQASHRFRGDIGDLGRLGAVCAVAP